MGPQNKSDRRSTKGVKHQSLCNDIKGRKGFKPIVGQTTQSRINCRIKVKIPCFYILKKDGSLRLVQDYRKLNQVTIKDKMPLSLIGEVIDKLKEARYFNKLDLIWGYNNVQIKEGDEWKAAFLTNKGLFEPQVIYFRLCNSPETFQRMMNSIF